MNFTGKSTVEFDRTSIVGVHLLADLHGVAPALLCDAALLSRCLEEAAARAKLTPLSAPVVHAFPNGALTAFLPLRESHIALHSYPEHEYLALDLFSCGNAEPADALAVFCDALAPTRVDERIVPRGALERGS
ncbi:MAG TPA: adenosylmethionine decarboxylase [Abditibacteriaceae bacterium]